MRENADMPDPIARMTVDWRARFPKLHGLFGNYLHQDWPDFHETAVDALQEGIDDRTTGDLRATLEEIQNLLALGLSEQELHAVIHHALGSDNLVSGRTQAEWLNEVAEQVAKAVAARADEHGRQSG
jgi:hypothetical protein